jgi:uncharacterized protein YjiS (DUF1127 family)
MTMLSNIPGHPPAAFRNRTGVGNRSRPGNRSRAGRLLVARFKRFVDHLVAAVIARHERHAAFVELRQLSDRELKDIGIRRYQIGEGLDDAAETRARLQGFDRWRNA